MSTSRGVVAEFEGNVRPSIPAAIPRRTEAPGSRALAVGIGGHACPSNAARIARRSIAGMRREDPSWIRGHAFPAIHLGSAWAVILPPHVAVIVTGTAALEYSLRGGRPMLA